MMALSGVRSSWLILARNSDFALLADWAASVTGHLGPNAPRRMDGVVYVGIAKHGGPTRGKRSTIAVSAAKHRLTSDGRTARQREAAEWVLRELRMAIEAQSDG